MKRWSDITRKKRGMFIIRGVVTAKKFMNKCPR